MPTPLRIQKDDIQVGLAILIGVWLFTRLLRQFLPSEWPVWATVGIGIFLILFYPVAKHYLVVQHIPKNG
jgi:fatty acid desaturase